MVVALWLRVFEGFRRYGLLEGSGATGEAVLSGILQLGKP